MEPGTVTFTSDPASRVLVLHGSGAAPGASLEVWVPGGSRPSVETTGIGRQLLQRVTGGWLLRAQTNAAAYSLRAVGS